MNETSAASGHIGVVLNPSKCDEPERFRNRLRTLAHTLGVEQGLKFYETTPEDPGRGQAQQAVADACSLVIAAGGDGTVRLVAAGLAGSSAAMGILPMGTGNLFARNLGIPIDNVERAFMLAIEGASQLTDLGWLGHGHSEDEARGAHLEPFLVIAGYGFDAAVMERTNSMLKKYVGWLAYVVAGAKHIVGRSQTMRIWMDGRKSRPLQARTVMIGNVGRLPGGINIMPGAGATNGSLEILALDWKGAAGFSQIASEMVIPEGRRSLARISHKRTFQAREMVISTYRDLPVQADGDYIGNATHLYAKVQPQALSIRVPKGASI